MKAAEVVAKAPDASSWTADDVVATLRGERAAPPGSELPAMLALWWAVFSRLFFRGKLPAVVVEVIHAAPRLLSRWEPATRGKRAGRVIIGAGVAVSYPWAVARLLHEAVHTHVVATLRVDESSYHGHGPIFCDTANRIGESIGTPRVAPKGRGDGALAADWPAGKPPPGERAAFVTAALLPLEGRELERLRVELDGVKERVRASRRVLAQVCTLVRRASAGADGEVERVVAKVGASGHKPAAARLVARSLDGLRMELVRSLTAAGDADAAGWLLGPDADGSGARAV